MEQRAKATKIFSNKIKMKKVIQRICCIGAGYVGGPTMAVIADRCKNIDVQVVDINEERINAWNQKDLNKLPVYEPGLEEIISRARDRNLFFSTNVDTAIANADMVFISVNTPTKTKGIGAGQASDLRWVEACARQVAKAATGHTIVVEKSTLPVRTAQTIKNILSSSNKSARNSNTFSVLSNPEFLAEGTAINDLEKPDRVLIGGEDSISIEALSAIYANWVPKEKILRTNLWSSELSKLTANAFLAQRISSINSVAAICEATGADVREVSQAIGKDSRIGSKFLSAGPGFGGSCFKKDILNLVYLSRHFGLDDVANYWEMVVTINQWQQKRISQLIVNNLFGTITGKKIAILGFAFKANTNDTRDSPAIQIINELLEEGAQVAIHDPKVTSVQISQDLQKKQSDKLDSLAPSGNWVYESQVEEAVKGSDAIIILTEWPQYKKLDWESISKSMRPPAWVFDTRSVSNPSEIKKYGINLWRIGDGANQKLSD
tara:strand:- start:123 stop:1598 length:1476 start_codon:yes stop_codon:yes gene_type:complete